MLRRMGPLQSVLKMIPGVGSQLKDVNIDERDLARVEAIVLSMTPHERRTPHLINGPRRQRIARGSGTTIEQVNQLLQARKQMEKMMKQMGKGKMPSIPAGAGMPNGAGTVAPARPRPTSTKKRKRAKRR